MNPSKMSLPLHISPHSKEVCNRGVACSLLKLGSLEKTVIASLLHSGLHSGTIFFVEKTMPYVILGNDSICPFFVEIIGE